jgi:hypothetical protein
VQEVAPVEAVTVPAGQSAAAADPVTGTWEPAGAAVQDV